MGPCLRGAAYILALTAIMSIDIYVLDGPHIANIYGYFPLWVGFVAIGMNVLTFLLSMALEKLNLLKVYLYLIFSRSICCPGIQSRSMRSLRRTTTVEPHATHTGCASGRSSEQARGNFG